MEGNSKTMPINELSYLKRNAVFCISLGIFFIIDFIYSNFYSPAELEFISFLLFLLAIICGLISIPSIRRVRGSVFWYGNFDDEYFNHLHNKGYKYSSSFLMLFLVVSMIISGIYPTFLSTLPIHEFCKLCAGCMFISYSLPILTLFKKDNE